MSDTINNGNQAAADPATSNPMLDAVKAALNIGGTYQDAALLQYIAEVKEFLQGAGVPEARITPGLVARGAADLWNYGSGEGKFSEYFKMRAIQAALQR